ncbi:hypothetical protein RhiirA5_365555 [Rhizophagus irregularis]|uniref:Uncharacterized protein n=1 Tax=Rhizophagus irregularis TaxID=588596 RepID=A0A2N1NHB5_9GLOM|nr:hypothetical protein RhiirA5_365555 [Rhizophagus irregularis]PKK73278.1 hypothetical protein RhiirC2_741163 [Rhizophagus irregularis]
MLEDQEELQEGHVLDQRKDIIPGEVIDKDMVGHPLLRIIMIVMIVMVVMVVMIVMIMVEIIDGVEVEVLIEIGEEVKDISEKKRF